MDAIVWVALIVGVIALAVTIYAAIDAFTNGRVGWGVGIIVGWLFGLGWLVAAIYLLAVRGPRVRAARATPRSDPATRHGRDAYERV